MTGTYVTDITHFFDDAGEIPDDMPSPGANLASFLVLVIDSTSERGSSVFDEIGMRCQKEDCIGSILSRIESETDDIIWHCTVCGHNGIIHNWQSTRWNQRKQ